MPVVLFIPVPVAQGHLHFSQQKLCVLFWSLKAFKSFLALILLPVFTLLISLWSSHNLTLWSMHSLLMSLFLCQFVPIFFRICINWSSLHFTQSYVFWQSMKQAYNCVYVNQFAFSLRPACPNSLSTSPGTSSSYCVCVKQILSSSSSSYILKIIFHSDIHNHIGNTKKLLMPFKSHFTFL
jgi:hypothetical protein